MEDYFARSPQKGLQELSWHCQVMTESDLTQMHEPACSEPNCCITSVILLLLFSKGSNWEIFLIRDLFLLINELHYFVAAICSLWITKHIYFYWLIYLRKENSCLQCWTVYYNSRISYNLLFLCPVTHSTAMTAMEENICIVYVTDTPRLDVYLLLSSYKLFIFLYCIPPEKHLLFQ